MADKTGDGIGAPATHWFAITPSDSVDLAVVPRGLYVGVSGTLTVIDIDGTSCTFVAAPVGYHPLRPKRVMATGTAATNILGLY